MHTEAALPPIDAIVFTPQAKAWLNKHGIMPSKWNLVREETDRILSANLALTIFNTPACTIPLVDIHLKIPNLQNVIQIDSSCIEGSFWKEPFSKEEVIAMLLHEIGHVVNPAPISDCYNEEGWADDYARHCGYHDHLLTALQKLLGVETSQQWRAQTQSRIDRIARGGKVNTRW